MSLKKFTFYRSVLSVFLCALLLPGAQSLFAQDIKWLKEIAGPSGDNVSSIAVDNAGNFYITGSFSGTSDFDPGSDIKNLISKGSTDIFLAKYDADGNYRWAFNIGAANADAGVTVAVDDAGHVLLTGQFRGLNVDFNPDPGVTNNLSTNNALSTNIFLAQYDTAGNYVWAKSMKGSVAQTNLRARGLTVDNQGNIYITGQFHGTVDFNGGSTPVVNLTGSGTDVYMAKYSSAGNCIWARKFGSTGQDIGYALVTDARRNVYITGIYEGTVNFDNNTPSVAPSLQSKGGADIFFAKYDPDGYHVWSRGVGQANSDIPYGIAVDASESVYVTGGFNGDVYFNPPSGALRLSGGSRACFLLKYDAEGDFEWVNTMPTSESSNGNTVMLDNAGNVVVGGYFQEKTNFTDGLPDMVERMPYGFQDYFVIRYKAIDGSFVDLLTPGDGTAATVSSSVTGIAQSPSGDIFIAGTTDGKVDFDPGSNVLENTPKGGDDIFILKIRPECATGSTFNEITCDSFVYNGKTYKNSGTFKDTFVNTLLCDSIVTFNLTITNGYHFPVYTGHYCDSVTFNGITYKVSGQYTQTYTSVTNCDSVYSYDITIGKSSPNTFLTLPACDSLVWNDTTVYYSSGVHVLTLTNQSGCDSTVVLDLTVNTTPVATLENRENILHAGNADSYVWINCEDNTVIDGAAEQEYIPVASGSYAVVVTAGGCSDTSDCVTVDLTAGSVPGLNGGHAISVAPNPTGNHTVIRSEYPLQDALLRIVNISGQVLHQNVLNGAVFDLDMTAFAPGIYFVEIQDKDRSVRLKLVKE